MSEKIPPAAETRFDEEPAISQISSSLARSRRAFEAWRILLLVCTFALFWLFTIVAALQRPGLVGMDRGRAWTVSFWDAPIEWNSIKRLPSINADLKCIFALRERAQIHVWAGGRDGVILHSSDGGLHWEQLSPVARQLGIAVNDQRLNFDWSLIRPAAAQTVSKQPAVNSQYQNTPNTTQLNQQRQLPTSASLGRKKRDIVGASSGPATPLSKRSTGTADPGSSPTPLSALTTDVDAVAFEDTWHGYVRSGEVLRPRGGLPSVQDVPGFKPAALYETKDGGKSWTSRQISYDKEEPPVLLALESPRRTVVPSPEGTSSFALSPNEGWACGRSGAVFHTTNAGITWLPQTQGILGEQLGNRKPYQIPAPWYYLALIGCVVMASVALKPIPVHASPERAEGPGIANLAVSDRPLEPGDPDILGCRRLAAALSAFIRNRNTVPPLTLAVTGEWGSGKSSVMNLLRRDLESFRLRPIWFNAWHNQTEENLFATLLQNLRLQGIPRWWEIDFLAFRWRLLMIRLRKAKVPLLVWACTVAALGGFELSHKHQNPSDISAIQNFFKQLFSADGFVSAIASIFKEPLVLFVLGLVSLSATVFSKLKAFGIDPSSLLLARADRPSTSDLEKQTSVRQQFAEEFREVTQALGPRKMVVFIDDLDRCQPDNACEVLEAVNFIVSSGDCFVLMGLARRPVEACVGLSFSKVAQEMTEPGAGPQQKESPASLRSRFAQQYLDKLINIEIPVPSADGRAEGMITAPYRAQERPKPGWHFARLLLGTVIAALAIYASFDFARKVTAQPPEPTPQASLVHNKPNPVLPTTGTNQGTGAGPANKSPEDGSANPGSPAASSAVPTPVLLPPIPRETILSPIALLGFLALFAIAYIVSTRRRGLVVYDSPEFSRALDIWKEFVVRTHPTPRSIKRYMNRVRCTAMRVHPAVGSESLWASTARWLGRRFSWLSFLTQGPSEESERVNRDWDTGQTESTIVALTAIHDTSPKWLDLSAAGSSGWLRSGMLPPYLEDPVVNDNLRSVLGASISKHAAAFPTAWPPSVEQMATFLTLMGSLKTR